MGRILFRGVVAVLVLGVMGSLTPAHAGKRKPEIVRGKDGLPEVAVDIKAGKEQYEMLERWGEVAPADSERADQLRRIMRQLAPHSDRPTLPYEITLVQSKTANAFSLPGGKIVVFEGLWGKGKGGILRKGREEEVAAVVAHEIAHASNRHWARRKFGREWQTMDEYQNEADYRGMLNMARAGYNPKAMLRIVRRMGSETGGEQFHSRKRSMRQSRDWGRGFSVRTPDRERLRSVRSHIREALDLYRETKRAAEDS